MVLLQNTRGIVMLYTQFKGYFKTTYIMWWNGERTQTHKIQMDLDSLALRGHLC